MNSREEYPDSCEDYEHNRPHYVILYVIGTFLMFLAFALGLIAGWLWL